jgi:putative addiction module killer protein
MALALRQTEVFRLWERRLRDRRARTLIAARLLRLAEGLPGDVSSVGEGVSESGYRVYFQQGGGGTIVLLCGGDKGSQSRDIAKAKRLARDRNESDG